MSAHRRVAAPDGVPAPGPLLVVGATSAIGRAVAGRAAGRGHDLLLTGRAAGELDAVARDLEIRHRVAAETFVLDVVDHRAHAGLAARCAARGVEGAVIAVGALQDPDPAGDPAGAVRRCLDVNLTGCASLAELLGPVLEGRGGGFLCVIGSVAGDRARAGSRAYGAAKAGLHAYLEALDRRLRPRGVTVTVVKAGWVDSRMTWGRVESRWIARPDRAARDIFRAATRGRRVVYVPRYWRAAMAVVRALPGPVLTRLGIG